MEKKSIWNWSRERWEDDGLEDWSDVTRVQGIPVVNRNKQTDKQKKTNKHKKRNGFFPEASERMAFLIP